MAELKPCKACGVLPVIETMGGATSPTMLKKGFLPIRYARYKCPECGVTPSWGMSYSHCERGMENNAAMWNKMFGADTKGASE